MKIGNLIADAVRHTVSGVTSTAGTEFKKAGKSMIGQVAYGKPASSQTPTENKAPKSYTSLSAKGETKKFGLSLMSQVSGKKFTYQELQELQVANEGKGNTVHDQLRAKINQMYQTHAQRNKQQEAVNQKKQEEQKQEEFREVGQRNTNLAPVRRDIAKTRTEIGKNFGAE